MNLHPITGTPISPAQLLTEPEQRRYRRLASAPAAARALPGGRAAFRRPWGQVQIGIDTGQVILVPGAPSNGDARWLQAGLNIVALAADRFPRTTLATTAVTTLVLVQAEWPTTGPRLLADVAAAVGVGGAASCGLHWWTRRAERRAQAVALELTSPLARMLADEAQGPLGAGGGFLSMLLALGTYPDQLATEAGQELVYAGGQCLETAQERRLPGMRLALRDLVAGPLDEQDDITATLTRLEDLTRPLLTTAPAAA